MGRFDKLDGKKIAVIGGSSGYVLDRWSNNTIR